MPSPSAPLHRYYECFNERRFDEAAQLFAADAVLEHVPFGRPLRGAEGYLEFARQWTQAFPDASLVVDRVQSRGDAMYEVDLRAEGTHLGTLEMGIYRFKPTGAKTSFAMRQLLEFRDDLIAFSSISFAPQDFIRQLVAVDYRALMLHLNDINRLNAALSASPDTVERREIVDRLGAALDAARNVLRPYYSPEKGLRPPAAGHE